MHELEAAQLQLISPARAAAASHRPPLAAPAGGAVARRAALGAAALGAAALAAAAPSPAGWTSFLTTPM